MTEIAERKRNWMPWLGLLLALAAIFSNAGFFLGLHGDKAIPWLSLMLAIAALVCAIAGVMRAFSQPQVYSGKISGSILGLLVLLICVFTGFGFIQSRALPVAAGAPQVGQKAPDFTLADMNGTQVSLAQLLGKANASPQIIPATSDAHITPATTPAPPRAVLLIFYRGWW
ncbi:MAG TPA: hypothetical protein VFF39_12485 [Verrucomicrobiae bacterium]|nr:hypothetical protein [Verrucomicrobiae bacterium]